MSATSVILFDMPDEPLLAPDFTLERAVHVEFKYRLCFGRELAEEYPEDIRNSLHRLLVNKFSQELKEALEETWPEPVEEPVS